MWDLIVSVPDHCLSFYSVLCVAAAKDRVVVFAGTKQEKPGPKSGTNSKVQKKVLELDIMETSPCENDLI